MNKLYCVSKTWLFLVCAFIVILGEIWVYLSWCASLSFIGIITCLIFAKSYLAFIIRGIIALCCFDVDMYKRIIRLKK